MSMLPNYRPLIMGILNVTPDSFYDGGKYIDAKDAVLHAKKMISEGAHIIDIGGESSRPGSEPISADEESKRVIPVIKALFEDEYVSKNVILSLDTFKPEVAEKCLNIGKMIINDITGLKNKNMLKIVAKHKVPAVIMHMHGSPKIMQKNPQYEDVVQEVYDFFRQMIGEAKQYGMSELILDPGIGFGKTLEHNLLLLKNIKRFKELGCPVMIGASRKSFINMISKADSEERLPGTISAHLYSLSHGADIIRVHDVKEHIQAVKVWGALNG